MKNRYITEVDHGLIIAAIIMVLLGLILFACGCGIHDDCPARGNWVPSRTNYFASDDTAAAYIPRDTTAPEFDIKKVDFTYTDNSGPGAVFCGSEYDMIHTCAWPDRCDGRR